MGDWAVSQIIDAIRYAQSLLRNHAHAAGDGSRGINTDVIIKSRKRIGPPLEVQSRQMNLRLNAKFWGGRKVGDPLGLPFVIERFPDIAHRPAFGKQGRLIYIDDLDVIQLDVGTAWLAIAEEGSIDWANILNKPSTFPPSAHQLDSSSYHTVSGLTTGHFLKATGATSFGFAAHGLSYGDVGAAAASHGDEAHSGSIIPDADQDFLENEALAFRVENLDSLPSAGNAGRLVCVAGVVYYDSGSGWVQF